MSDKKCSAAGCDKSHQAKGYCDRHYRRIYRGLPLEPETVTKPLCIHDGCERKSRSHDYCNIHYQRKLRGSDIDGPIRSIRGQDGCVVAGCDNSHLAKGYCGTHYAQHFRHGAFSGKVCSEEDCELPARAKGLCDLHYSRARLAKPMSGPSRRAGHPVGTIIQTKQKYSRIKVVEGHDGWMFHHHYVMEQHLGRLLLAHENVHHINGVRDDNRIENLELWSHSQPPGQRVSDKIQWAIDYLGEYGMSVSGQVPLAV